MTDLITVRVTAREEQGDGVVLLTLASMTGVELPSFSAGAHLDLHLTDGLVRQYSLCGDPQDRQYYRLGILHSPVSRGGSTAACALKPGDKVQVSAPRNLFPLVEEGENALLVGGGIGITPLLAMAHALHLADRPFALHYCGRSRQSMAFLAELAAVPWAGRVVLHISDEGSRLDPKALFDGAPDDSHLYACGPEGLMQALTDAAERAGLAADCLHQESFTPAAPCGGEAFEVSIPALDVTVQVGESQSIVQALAQAGVRVKVSCEQGICGTCLANVLEGTPDHRDQYLTEEEKADNDQVILCCSRARSARLVIEVFEVE
ncbi:oxidoreductase [Enterobacteriaceae bacterium BIT-l23]|uniref:PDR/VanB family oxidoreductase n=1 Tax=Jejubacter sp. L23 TaxID=3092086 RepID=UPI001584C098|nr:oxidoreductase [Enterobacteriaceae bacterium BIT-l23]